MKGNSKANREKKAGSGRKSSQGSMFKGSIGTKIAFSIAAAVLLMAVVLGVIAVSSIRQSTYDALGQNLKSSAVIAANVVSGKLDADISQVQNLSDEVNTIAAKELKRLRIDLLKDEFGFQVLGMADEAGLLAGKGETVNVSDQEFFIKVKETSKPFVSDLILSDDKTTATYIVAVPYLVDGTFKGVFYAQKEAMFLSEVVKEMKMGEKGSTYILNNQGTITAYENTALVLAQDNSINNAKKDPKVAPMAAVAKDAIQGKYENVHFYTYNGVNKIAVSAAIVGSNGWSLVVTANQDEYTQGIRTSLIVVVLAAVILLLLSVGLAIVVSRNISKPIKTLEVSARQMAGGDLGVSIESKGHDEVAQLASTMRIMQANLRLYVGEIRRCLSELAKGNLTIETDVEFEGDFGEIRTSIDTIIEALHGSISEVKDSADRIAASSEQVASGAQALASGTTEQASTIQEISAMISEISSQAEGTARNSVVADKKTQSAVAEIENCNIEMTSLSAAMDEISKSSGEISKIIKTIEDIAFQTNILALNAAVEAARAGDAGRGFAVVADEVRNLASKSSAAAKNTTDLIEGTISAVQHGMTITDKTAGSLNRAVSNVKEMVSLINEISTAADQQAKSVEQVNSGVEQISQVIQNNSATAEESAASSEEMMSFAHMLKKITETFEI